MAEQKKDASLKVVVPEGMKVPKDLLEAATKHATAAGYDELQVVGCSERAVVYLGSKSKSDTPTVQTPHKVGL